MATATGPQGPQAAGHGAVAGDEPGASPKRTGKPRELQGWSNRAIFHPLARRLATVLVPTPITPNAVSISGALIVMAAGLLYTHSAAWWAIPLAFALHLAWHVVDGADGDLARLTGRASAHGELIDGLSDYAGHLVLYVLLGLSLQAAIGPVAWVLAIAAGASRIVQSIYAESQRRTYLWWAYEVPWLQTRQVEGRAAGLAGLYVQVAEALTGPTQAVNTVVAASQHDPAERRRIAALAVSAGRRTLPLQIALGANPRTVLLGVSMLVLGGPMGFFLIEAVALNVLLAVSLAQQARSCRRLLVCISKGRR